MAPIWWARSIAHLIRYAASRGASEDKLLADLSLPPTLLVDSEARVPSAVYYDVLEYAAHTLDDPCFGIHYIEAFGFASSDALGFSAMFSPTIGESMTRFIAFLNVLNGKDPLIELRTDGPRTQFVCTPWGPDRPGKAQVVEMFAAGFLSLPARLTGPFEATSLRFAHPSRGEAVLNEHRRVLGASPEYGADENSWSFPTNVLRRPMEQSDPRLVEFFDRYLESLASTVSHVSLDVSVSAAIERGLVEARVQLKDIAEDLQLSERTLQRQLHQSGISFEDLLTDIRLRRSRVLLLQALPLAEISARAGYADVSSFQRAFKRWTGTTPSQWRSRHRRAANTSVGGGQRA